VLGFRDGSEMPVPADSALAGALRSAADKLLG